MINRKSPPPFVQSKSFNLLTPEIQVLSNGARMVTVQGGEQEIIKIELIFNAGKWFEPNPGVSHFTSTILSKGTENYTSYQITELLDFYGVHLEIHPGFDFATLSVYSLAKNLPFVLDLLVDIISGATFPDLEIQQAKDIYTQSLRINLEKTSYLASREFRKNLFGISHPYGSDIDFNHVERVDKKKLAGFHLNYFSDFTVFTAGKISDKLKNSIADKLGQLIFKRVNPPQHAKKGSTEKDFLFNKEDGIQTSLRLGKPIIGRSHPDYPGLLLANHILGGYFGSRLMKNIREEKGLTYGIQSSLQALKQDCYFVIGADVNNENRELAILEIKKELARLREQELTIEELEVARNHFIGSLQTEMNTPFAHLDKIKLITLFNLSPDFYQQLVDVLFKISIADINNLANTYLSEENLYTVAVGKM